MSTMMPAIQRVDVLGVQVSAVNPDIAVELISNWVDSGRREYVCVRDVHGVVRSLDDPELRRIHNESGLVTPDGMPLVWAGHYAGAEWMSRVYGPDLLLDMCERSLESGYSHYFYGAAPGVADDLAAAMAGMYPGLKVAGTHSPPFRELTEDEAEETAEMLNRSGADIVWIGLSSPKQEQWMARFRSKLDAPVIIGVGAAFDMHAGRVRQAPKWMQKSGLEWAFRVAVEPRRLWRRYAVSIPRFAWRILWERPRLLKSSDSTVD